MTFHDTVSSARRNAAEELLWSEEVEEQRLSESEKFSRILARLNPFYSVMLYFRSRTSLRHRLKPVAVLTLLCFSFINMPLFASDSILPPLSPTQSSTPVIAVSNTTAIPKATTAPVVQGGQPFSADQFVMAGSLSLATTTVQSGRTLYVSTTGSNTADGTTASPYGTIQYAVTQLQAGDTLHIAAGNYNVTAGGTFVNSGTADAHITVIADPGTVLDGTNLYAYTPVFNTGGQSYLDFQGLNVINSRAAVSVTSNSSNIMIDGLHTDHNQMAVIIDQGSYVTVKNSVAAHSRNGFIANNTSNHLTFENVEAYGSEDIYAGYETLYRNGDGFIMNLGTHDVVFKNIISHDNWDGGIDSKAVNTLIDGAIVYSNKNNFKIWADTVIQNSMSFGARILTDDPVSGEGNGLNARTGNITIINSTFFDNANHDIQVDAQGPASNVTVENSIFYRNISTGKQVDLVGGVFTEKNNIFYWAGKASSPEFALSSTSKWLDPQFVSANAADLPLLNNTTDHTRDNELVKPKIDLHLKSTSPAVNAGLNSLSQGLLDLSGLTRIVDSAVDLGAYEYQAAQIDVTAPVISAVVSTSVTAAGATINWTTNEVSDSQVQYRAQGSTVWLNTTLDASLVSSHSVTLAGLNASSVYEYQVMSKDAAGNLAIEAAISNFATLAPPDVTAPAISAVVSTSVTAAGATINWTTNEVSDSQVQYRAQGSTVWLNTTLDASLVSSHSVTLAGLNASSVYEYQVKSKDAAGNLATASTISSFTTTVLTAACTTAMCGVTNAQTVSGTIKVQPNLTLNPDIKKVSYYLNGASSTKEYASPFIWGGTGFDTTKLTDGTYTLSGALTTKAGDQNFSLTFTVKNIGTVDITAPVISSVVSSGVTVSGAVISWATNELSDSQVQYRAQGSSTWLNTPLNASFVTNHSVALAGLNASTVYEYQVMSKDQAGNPGISAVISNFKTAAVTTAVCTTAMCGMTDGQTVSGIIKVQPNLTLNPDIKKVSYYLNGAQSSKEYAAPFIWGGTGFDTSKLAEGTYTLGGAYTTATGDHNFSITFTVKNTVVVPPPVCTTAMCGVTSGQTVSGTVFFQPSEALVPSIKKVAYYLNGVLYERTYTAPYVLGGTAGFDTTKLVNGTYTISGAYATAAGDIPFTVTFTVKN